MGCNCGGGGTRLATGVDRSDAVATLRSVITTTLGALGDADPCPTTRVFVVKPTSGAIERFAAADYSGDPVAAMEAALARLGELGGGSTIKHGCHL